MTNKTRIEKLENAAINLDRIIVVVGEDGTTKYNGVIVGAEQLAAWETDPAVELVRLIVKREAGAI